MGRKTTSDPFVRISLLTEGSLQAEGKQVYLGKTATCQKTLEPTWNFRLNHQCQIPVHKYAIVTPQLYLDIFDEDLLSESDFMGRVIVDIPKSKTSTTDWYDVDPQSAKNASGRLHATITTSIHRVTALSRGNALSLQECLLDSKQQGDRIRIGVAWDMLNGRQNIDLDTSCVAITRDGQYSKDDSVYYGHTSNRNGSIVHSGDEREGDEVGDDESISIDLDRIPPNIVALYCLLTVVTPGLFLSDIRTTNVRVMDKTRELGSFRPADSTMTQNATALLMLRMSRVVNGNNSSWTLQIMEETHPTARDYGTLLPHIKSYTRDLIPNITIDPTERAALLRKGGTIRLEDYCPNHQLPPKATFGLAWDMTDGKNIDLDASVICLDKNLQVVDLISYKHLRSNDGSIQHHGDEREGDALGDDEKVDVIFSQVHSSVKYVGFIINSFSGQELDDVNRASCHLFNPITGDDMASYAMTNSTSLNGFTALLIALLYRGDSPKEESWSLSIMAEAAHGKTVQDNVDELQNYIRRNPPKIVEPMEEEIDLSDISMPENVPIVEEEIDLSK